VVPAGAAISATGGTLTVRECLIYENRSTGVGGAIAVVGGVIFVFGLMARLGAQAPQRSDIVDPH